MSATERAEKREEYRTTYDEPQSATHAIVEALASVTERSPTEVGPLYETVDPDALVKVLQSAESGRVEFFVDGHRVTVDASGQVVVSRSE